MTTLALAETSETASDDTYPLAKLSVREREIFDRIVLRGMTTVQISKDLGISQKTVESHRTHINRKLKCSSPYELLKRALVANVIKVADLTS